jgi:hypothetical protein
MVSTYAVAQPVNKVVPASAATTAKRLSNVEIIIYKMH